MNPDDIVRRQQQLAARREFQRQGERMERLQRALARQDGSILQLGALVEVLEGAWNSPWLSGLRDQGRRRLQAASLGRPLPEDDWVQQLQVLLEPAPEEPDFDREAMVGRLVREVDERLWRSPQPFRSTLEQLRTKGLSAVVSLREEPHPSMELCAELGLTGKLIPVPDQGLPSLEQVWEFLDFVAEQPGRSLVHCWAGQGRTGIFVALYRIWTGQDPEVAARVTDDEIHSRGMRSHQRRWVLSVADQVHNRRDRAAE